MFLMDWQLAIFSLALLPVFLDPTQARGARAPADDAATQQRTLADLSTLVLELLALSGSSLAGRWAARRS